MKNCLKKSALYFSVCAMHVFSQTPLAMMFSTDDSCEGAKKSYNSKKNNHNSGATTFTDKLLNPADFNKSTDSDQPKIEEVSQVTYAPKNSFAITTRSGKTVADGEKDQATMLGKLQSEQPQPGACKRFFLWIFCCGKGRNGKQAIYSDDSIKSMKSSSTFDLEYGQNRERSASIDSTAANREGKNKANQHQKEQQQNQQLFAPSESSINDDQSRGFFSKQQKDSLLL